MTYSIPAGYPVESGPKTHKISRPDQALFSNATGTKENQTEENQTKENQVNVVSNLAYVYTVVGPQDYGSLHDFFVKVAEAYQQPLVLTRATAVAAKTSDAVCGKSP